MKGWLLTARAVLLGLVLGSLVNLGLVTAGAALVPLPAGVDPADTDSVAQAVHRFEFRHFVFPFLAHALGTFTGALVAALVARSHAVAAAVAVGMLFFAGGVAASTMIPAPLAFVVTDLLLAYGPTAAAGLLLARRVTAAPARERDGHGR